MTSESPDAVAPLREDEMMHDTDSSMVVEPTPNISVYLEEIAKLRRDLQGAQKLAEHRLQVIFELQDAAARVGSAEEKQEGEAEAPKVKLQSLSKSTADCSAPVARPKLLSRQGMLTLKDNNPTYAAKENRAASVRATSVTSAAKSIKRASRMREESQHADPLRGLNPNTGAPAQTTPSVESACANTPGSPRPKKLLRRPLTKPSSSSLPAEERRGEETALRRRVKKSIESSATTSLQTAETDKKRPTTASSLKKLAPSENGGKRDVRRSRTASASEKKVRVPRLSCDGRAESDSARMSLSTVEEVPNQSYRLRSLQERYESAKVSLALLRGLILRSDTSLFSLLGKLNSLNRPEKVFQTALSTLRGMVEQVRPEAFRHKAREGALWLFNSEEICLLEEANIIGIAPVLRDLVASHDWTRRSNRSLFSRGTEGVAVGKGEVNFGTSLESSFFEFYVNLHIFLTLAQSASVSKQIN